MAARQSKTTRKRATKKATTRKRATKKAPAKPKSTPAPIEGKAIRGEMKYKLKAAHLEWAVEHERIIREAQDDIQKLLNKKRRNDAAYKRTNRVRLAAYNEVIDALTPKLPADFAIKNIDAVEGTYNAEYDPENRGQHIES